VPLKVDVTTDEGKSYARKFRVMGVPYLAVINKSGRVVDNLDARADEETIVAMLKNSASH
jgi:thioredoxin-like negative regulator of GroEL